MAIADLAARDATRGRTSAWTSEDTRRGSLTRRTSLVIALLAGLAWGSSITGAAETASSLHRVGPELAQLLRFMALLKAGLALTAVAAVIWRLGATITPAWLAAYLLSASAMAAGPALIWDMARVGLGALLLHGGLLATLLLLWRDPAVSSRLSMALAARRTAPGDRPPCPSDPAGAPERQRRVGGTGKASTSPV